MIARLTLVALAAGAAASAQTCHDDSTFDVVTVTDHLSATNEGGTAYVRADADFVGAHYAAQPYWGHYFLSRRASDDWQSAGDFVIDTEHERDADTALFQVYNHGSPRLLLRGDGTVYAGSTQYSGASFIDGSGVSGHPTLSVSHGQYVAILGQLPTLLVPGSVPTEYEGLPYDGQHGAVTILNGNAKPAGWLLQVMGTAQTHQFIVDYTGSFGQPLADVRSSFHLCPPTDSTPWGSGTGAGQSLLQYASDEQRWYYCDANAGWKAIAKVEEVSTLASRVAALEARLDGGAP